MHPWDHDYEKRIREKYKPHPLFWGRYELFLHHLMKSEGFYTNAEMYAMCDEEVVLLLKLAQDQMDIMMIQWRIAGDNPHRMKIEK